MLDALIKSRCVIRTVVKGTLALLLIGAAVGSTFAGIDAAVSGPLWTLAGVVVTHYFQSEDDKESE